MSDGRYPPMSRSSEAARQRRRRMVMSLGLVALGFLGLVGGLELAASHGPLGQLQDETVAYLDKAERKATEAFAAGRAINAAASILKSTEVSPIVVKIAPMEVLEPVDDLAKQFSDIMAVSIAALLLQRLVLSISEAWALGILLPALGRSVVLLALFVRFVIPIAGWVGDELTEQFLARDLNEAVSTMNASHGSLAATPDANAQPAAAAPARSVPTSWWEALGRRSEAAGSWLPDRAGTTAIVTALESVPDQIIKAIEIFLVQTILTPLTVGLLFYYALRSLVRPIRPDRVGL